MWTRQDWHDACEQEKELLADIYEGDDFNGAIREMIRRQDEAYNEWEWDGDETEWDFTEKLALITMAVDCIYTN